MGVCSRLSSSVKQIIFSCALSEVAGHKARQTVQWQNAPSILNTNETKQFIARCIVPIIPVRVNLLHCLC